MKIHALCLLGITLAAGTPLAMAANPAHGEELQQQNCTSCHGDSVYTRKDRKVTSLSGLRKQVQRCELTLGLQWFDDDVDDVVSYLNQEYYQYKP